MKDKIMEAVDAKQEAIIHAVRSRIHDEIALIFGGPQWRDEIVERLARAAVSEMNLWL